MNTDPISEPAGAPVLRKLTLFAADLAGYTRGVAEMDALELARFLDGYYRLCGGEVRARGGRVVKFMGDACFATFPEDACVAAVECAQSIVRLVGARRERFFVGVGANIHLSTVAEAELGADEDRRYDVIGAGVNHLFRMGGGAGIRISEPVYRQLPNERRGDWHKQKPPATYTYRG